MAFQQHIPDEVVFSHIFYRLDIITRVRFTAVCRLWRALSREATPPMPCFFCFGTSTATSSTTDHRVPSLFDPISTTSHNLPYPGEMINRPAAGCHGPYLAYTVGGLSSSTSYSCDPTISASWPPRSFLYNPFSGETLQLPCTARYPDGRIKPMGSLFKAQLSSTPSSGRPCLVAAVTVDSMDTIYICWAGQDGQGDQWVASALVGDKIHDLIFHKGELYCICDKARILAFDLQRRHPLPNTVLFGPTPRTVTPGSKPKPYGPHGREFEDYLVRYNLVESCGELLVVTQFEHWEQPVRPKIYCDVHRVEEDGALVRVDDLGDTLLFLGWGCSRSWQSCGYSELHDEFFRKNCIYFTQLFEGSGDFKLRRFCVGSSFAESVPTTLPSFCLPPWISLSL